MLVPLVVCGRNDILSLTLLIPFYYFVFLFSKLLLGDVAVDADHVQRPSVESRLRRGPRLSK
jgi:hypothetical protein